MQRTPFDIPDQMREAADRGVDQAKQAFDRFLDATQDAVAQAETSAKSLREGAADLNRQTLAYVEENVTAAFDLAQKLVRARTVEEVAALQQEYLKRQVAAANEQGKALGEMFARTAQNSAKKPAR